MKEETKKNGRLMSLDALRGFDMWFITGGAALITALCKACGCGNGWLATQMQHVNWVGLAHHDTIFPLFLFMAGVTWPFSYAAQLAKGRTSWQIHRKVLLRAFILFCFGIAPGGILRFDPEFRLMSVLGYIGLCWGIAAILYMHVKKTLPRALIVIAALFGYWALLRFNIAPDAPAGADSFSLKGNIVAYWDRMLWPTHLYYKGEFEAESLFSLSGGVVLALAGMFSGQLLRRDDLKPGRKALILLGVAAGSFAATMFFIHVLGDQIVKRLWTSSFILAAITYSAAMLALFYWLIDVKGWRGWTFYFRVIGMNSITIYMTQMIWPLTPVKNFFFTGLAGLVPTNWSQVVLGVGYLAVVWAYLYFLYRKNIFLKV